MIPLQIRAAQEHECIITMHIWNKYQLNMTKRVFHFSANYVRGVCDRACEVTMLATFHFL